MITLTRRHVLLGSFATAAAALSFPTRGSAAEFINIATGGTSGVYYPLGVALSKVYGSVLPDAKISVQATKASVENLNLIQAGRAEVAFSLGDAVADAWNGEKEAGFNNKLTKLRAIGGLYNNYVQIVASEASGIKTLADLKGKRISVGAPRSGTELNARAVLGAAGLTYDDFSKVEYLPFGESVDLMKNRQLDVTLQSAGLGVSSIKDLATSIPIVVVPVPQDVVEKIGNPAYQPSVIPAGTYEGQPADVPAVAITNILVTREDLSEDTVYQLTKSMFDHLSDLVSAHSAAKGIDPNKAAKNLPIPLHPGAERYYKETGVL
ncbi:TAXI family TRAP transporter solute-binding subunit [Rhodoligotrophos defluvii]|uniref:TAXI family TRAP transporter solute-binding subunit n=1 Tax=Rhodoligotrophos defluvii TaxID=2561934 RepID=UPI0010C9CDB5|nr:TAXI family TRAP transporter solute-binding subunit [Rhodoligotrophos defluvii]